MTFTIICLDGFRYDYLEKAEFMTKLADNSLHGKLNPGVGYSSEFSAITGEDTEELGILTNNFFYNPGKLKFFHALRLIDKFPLKRKLRLLLELMYNLKEFLIGNCQPKSIFNIPMRDLFYFDYLMKKNFFLENSLAHRTIFDFFMQENKKVSGYMWPFIYKNNSTRLDVFNLSLDTANTDERALKKSLKLLKKNPDIFYVHFFSTDNLVHKYGVNSEKTDLLIKKLDSYVKLLADSSDKLLIFSDHGMVDVKETFDIKKELGKTNFVLRRDYVMFLDSALARFWFFNKDCEKAFREILANSKKGSFLNFKNKEIHRKFGQLIFLVKPGVLILPNFYQEKADKATHGYSDNCKDEKGLYIFHEGKNNKKKKDIKIKEIYKIITSNA